MNCLQPDAAPLTRRHTVETGKALALPLGRSRSRETALIGCTEAEASCYDGSRELPVNAELKLPLNLNPGYIRCTKREIVLTRESECISTLRDGRSIYRYLSTLNGLSGFQDHFDWWARNNFSNKGGKPFWVDPHDQTIQHIFIDDNIRLNDDDTIIHPQVFFKKEGSRCRTALTSELYDSCLVQTDLLSAIADQDYFIKKVRHCEENYDAYLEELPS